MNQQRPEGWDWRAEIGRHEGRAAHEALDDQISVFRFLFRLLTLPVRLPLYVGRVFMRRRLMIRFAHEMSRDRPISQDTAREVSLSWVKSHPDRYPLGEYDPRMRRLQDSFERILRRLK